MTITIVENRMTTVLLPKGEDLQVSDLGNLLQAVGDSGLLGENEKSRLETLQEQYRHFPDLNAEAESEFLFQLSYHVLNPSIDHVETDEEEDRLLGLSERISDRLRQILPDNMDVEAFIDQCVAEEVVIAHLMAVDQLYQDLFILLNDSAVAVNEKMKLKYEELKHRVLEAATLAEGANHTLQNHVEAIVQKVNTLVEGLSSVIEQGKQIEHDFKSLQETMKQNYQRYNS